MGTSVKINIGAIKSIEKAAREAALETMEQLRIDLITSQTMPFDTGDMQNNQTFVDVTENGAVLVTGSPQARRLYYNPEYKFQQGKNANAGAYWLDPYITGDKKDFVKTEFEEALKKKL